ncbi:hypothetical protein FJZ40_02895 [Candidatus Shapirobacteria bacterium]|nr:hypothetical protein [Candidatus Shapirobacteria bacterium]
MKLINWLKDNFIFWATGFLLLFIPLYPKFPLLSVSGTYVSIRIEDFLVAGTLAAWFILFLIREPRQFLGQTLPKLFLLYFLVGGLSLVSAVFITKNVTPHLALLHYFRRIEYMSLLFVAYDAIRRPKDIKIYALIFFLATTGVIVYGIGQKFWGWPVISTMNREFSKGLFLQLTWWARVNSTFAGHYDLAAYLVLTLSLTAAFFTLIRSIKLRIITLFFAIASLYLLILTASRISFPAYLVAATFILFSLKKYWWIPLVLAFSILGMLGSADFSQRYAATFKIDLSFLSGTFKVKQEAVIVPTVAPTPTILPPIVAVGPTRRPGERVTPTPTPTPTPIPPAEPVEPTELAVTRSTDIRLKAEWPRALRAFAKNPLLGTGYSSITLATDNDYLRILGETGILGALAFLLIFIEIGRKVVFFLRRARPGFDRTVVIGICGAAAGFLLNALFIDVFEASKVAFIFWILMGVMLKVVDLNSVNS